MIVYPSIFITTADTALGKADVCALSDQQRMEIIFNDMILDFNVYQAHNGDYIDCCTWREVECDSDGNVVSIDVDRLNGLLLNGTLNTAVAPPHLKVFDACDHELTGAVSFDGLPDSLTTLVLKSNKLSGTLDLRRLPSQIDKLTLGENLLSGSLDFSSLPATLRNMSLEKNRFSGSIDWMHLPGSMQYLMIDSNELSGTVCFDSLPSRMVYLRMSENRFSGEFIAPNLPKSLLFIEASANLFEGTAVVPPKTAVNIHLHGTNVSAVVDAKGRCLPDKTFGIDNDAQFGGLH